MDAPQSHDPATPPCGKSYRWQRRVSFVARCTRALFLASYRALAGGDGLPGADKKELLEALRTELPPRDRERVEARWELYVRLVRRQFGDGAIKGKSRVFFEPFAHALGWLEAFNRINHRRASRPELLQLVETPTERQALWAEGLIEMLGFLSILRCSYWVEAGPSAEAAVADFRVYVIHQDADPSLVLGNLFGRSTDVSGLDYLLYGGLWVPGGQQAAENLTVAISGSAGLGKSTLAMSIAAQVAARGGLALYLHFQLESRTVQRQLTQLQRQLMPFFRRARLGEPGGRVTADPGRGLLLISPMPTTTPELIEAELGRLTDTSDDLARRRGPFAERLVVFDSISACEGYDKSGEVWRTFLDRLAQRLRTCGYNIVFLLERVAGLGDGFENFLVDVDLRLETMLIDGYLFRTLSVVKTRWQASHRGGHLYTIRTNGGLQVYPASAAIAAVQGKREPHTRRRVEGAEAIDPGIRGFTALLGKREGTSGKGAAHYWWTRGSTTSLLGERGTLKTAFGAAFCERVQADVVANSDPGGFASALFLHFSAETHKDRQPIFTWKRARPRAVGTRYDVPVPGAPPDSNASVTHLFFRSGYLAPGQVLQVVLDLIAEKRRLGVPIRRAVVADAGNIAPDFPALRNDLAFIPALCSILSSEAITTLLIYSYPEHGAKDWTQRGSSFSRRTGKTNLMSWSRSACISRNGNERKTRTVFQVLVIRCSEVDESYPHRGMNHSVQAFIRPICHPRCRCEATSSCPKEAAH